MSIQHRFFPDKEPRLEEVNLKVEMARTQLENRLKQTKNKQNLIVFTKDQSHEKAASVEATCDHEGPKKLKIKLYRLPSLKNLILRHNKTFAGSKSEKSPTQVR